MNQYIHFYLRVGQRPWCRKIFGGRRTRPLIVSAGATPNCFTLDEDTTKRLIDWCELSVKDTSKTRRQTTGDGTHSGFSCALTKRECAGFLEECKKLIEQCDPDRAGIGQNSAQSRDAAGRLCHALRGLADTLEDGIKHINWTTSNCVVIVENSPGVLID